MIPPDAVGAALRLGPDSLAALGLARAEEAWEPVLLGGMIPILGAGGIAFILWRAIKSNPENDPPGDGPPELGPPGDDRPEFRPPGDEPPGDSAKEDHR